MGETHPGFHCYGGEFYFISHATPEVEGDELPNGLQFKITVPSPLEPDGFHNVPGSRCFSFVYNEIPWVLDERP